MAPEALRLFETSVTEVEVLSQRRTAPESLDRGPLRLVARTAILVAKAQRDFARAVISARASDFSWRQIGVAAGIPHQSLHRRFGESRGLKVASAEQVCPPQCQ